MNDSLCSGDLGGMLSVVDTARDDDPGPLLPWAVLVGLGRLIPAEEVSFAALDVVNQRREIQQAVLDGTERCIEVAPADHPDGDASYWQHQESFWASAPFGQGGRVGRWSDLYSPRELRRQPLYAEFFALDGVKHFMGLGFPTPTGAQRNLLFFRHSGRDFTSREKLMLQLLRPHLFEIYRDAERRRHDLPRLTFREWQVLQLVAQGHSNAEIARALFTSVGTVRKHLEHIFDHTGARTRSAAVAKMMPNDFVGWSPPPCTTRSSGQPARRPPGSVAGTRQPTMRSESTRV
jgi:DNA-binding CsgD family transcriptional regulator